MKCKPTLKVNFVYLFSCTVLYSDFVKPRRSDIHRAGVVLSFLFAFFHRNLKFALSEIKVIIVPAVSYED